MLVEQAVLTESDRIQCSKAATSWLVAILLLITGGSRSRTRGSRLVGLGIYKLLVVAGEKVLQILTLTPGHDRHPIGDHSGVEHVTSLWCTFLRHSNHTCVKWKALAFRRSATAPVNESELFAELMSMPWLQLGVVHNAH